MPRMIEGGLDAKGLKFAIVAGRYNDFIVTRLIQGAMDCLLRHGAADGDVTVCRVPGSFEIPQVARELASTKRFDAVVCLGALVRGETSHFDTIAAAVARGISRAGEETGVPVTLGVLTTDSMEQAVERAGGKGGNKGWDAALAAIELANVRGRLPAARARR